MSAGFEKRKKLAYVARRYYLEDRKQSDIARELGVSRPLVSRMLSEARELGIVEIKVHEPGTRAARMLDRLRAAGSVRGGILVEDGADNDATNRLLSQGAVELLHQLGARRLGVGWGYLIGQLVTWLEENPQPSSAVTDICPLVGNASIPARNYQSNENVRLMAQQLGAVPHFLYLPALPEGLEEKQILCSTEVYRRILQQWEALDTALVNIGDYPSSPDFASLVRYGGLLQRQRACGRMLIYYFNEATLWPVRTWCGDCWNNDNRMRITASRPKPGKPFLCSFHSFPAASLSITGKSAPCVDLCYIMCYHF